MNVWYTIPTIFKQRRVLQIAVLLTLCVALITTLFFNVVTTHAAPGVNKTVSYQGRLLTKTGSPVPDGYYNIQFKIYQDGTGTQANNTGGTLEWTENYTNNGGNNGVFVKNGYLSVDLGSKNPFASHIDWNQDTLWLSMNIAGSSTVCTVFGTAPCLADGEMLPMKRLTASPYSLNSDKLDGMDSSDFIQNTTTQQTGNFYISGTGRANTLQGNTSVIAPLFDTANTGTTAILGLGSVNAGRINIGSPSGTQFINIGNGTGIKRLEVGSKDSTSRTLIQGGSLGVIVDSAGGFNVLSGTTRSLDILSTGDVAVNLKSGSKFSVNNSAGSSVFSIDAAGTSTFNGGLTSKGALNTQSANGTYTGSLSTQDGGSTTVSSTGNSVVLQGGATNLLTAVNNNGSANVGIGNAASNGYALDVTGEINASDEYLINGVSVLNNSGLSFSGAGTSTITASDGEMLQLSSDTSVRIGDGTASGEPTLLTLDKSDATPTATGDAVLGSMYYDTTLGKVQCYEADGWGSCSSSPDNFITLSPEYTNAVTNGTGVGDFTSDICSDTLNINDGSSAQPTICGTNETYNFYKWTTNEESAQTKDIYVTYQLPSSFTGFVEGSTSLVGRTDNAAASVDYQVYKNTANGLVACGSVVNVSTGAQTTWQKETAVGSADPANCNFSANDSIVFKISLSSEFTVQQTNAYASTLSFAFGND